MPTKNKKSVSKKSGTSVQASSASSLNKLSLSSADTIIPTGMFLFISLLIVVMLIVGFVAIF